MDKCPRCGHEQIASGTLSGSDGPPSGFSPKGLKWWKYITSVPFVPLKNKKLFLACSQCGLVWSEVDPSRLNRLIEENGNDQAKKSVGLI